VQTTQTNLLRAVRDSRNRQAWGDFYRIYAPMLHHFARRLGLQEPDIDDVTQEVLMIAQRSLQDRRYDPRRGRFRSWLYGIARRQALAALRARRRRTRVQLAPLAGEDDPLQQIQDPRTEETMSAIWHQEWRYAMLEEALRHIRTQVGEKSFQAFCRYAIERRPVRQVARELGLSTSSVYVYKSRVLDAIRRWIRQFEEP